MSCNVGADHLTAAIESYERHCTSSWGDVLCGSFNRMGLPSNGQAMPLGADQKLAPYFL
ncbi:hypothetical protein SynTAK9802_02249 [Synechococcus sp. TAK9802]|nr:hypothetical protein SynTAK9802_02249 [Synechococcus sp. TAK9802]